MENHMRKEVKFGVVLDKEISQSVENDEGFKKILKDLKEKKVFVSFADLEENNSLEIAVKKINLEFHKIIVISDNALKLQNAKNKGCRTIGFSDYQARKYNLIKEKTPDCLIIDFRCIDYNTFRNLVLANEGCSYFDGY